MFFNWFRPKPKFNVGQLAGFSHPDLEETSYLLIERRRWIRPSGETKKRWVYDGIVLKIEGGGLAWSTYGYTIGEKSLTPIPGLE